MFEIKEYHKEFYIEKKLIGKIILQKPDRETFGYSGKRIEILQEDIIFKKKYKKGTQVITELSQVCGKLIGTQEDKINILFNSRVNK
tara:strand:- start:245 stop:505 length:261 start_codon:yes stop_codon:yes gene_type:complete